MRRMGRPNGTTKTAFLQKAKKAHGDSYDYSGVEIDPTLKVSEHPPVKIRCKRHNYIFYENPSKHHEHKRYSYRSNVCRLPICCQRGNDIIFLNGGFSEFLDKINELGQTMTRTQISEKLGYKTNRFYLYRNIKKCEKQTGRKVKINHALCWSSKYVGQNGWVKTQWGLSLFENGVEKERECKSCHSILKLDQFHTKSSTELIPRRECKKCWMENKVMPWKRDHPDYRKERAQRDPLFKLTGVLRSSVSNAIKTCKENGVDVVKQEKTLDLLGAQSWQDVFDHFEALFTPGMTWQNHGGGHNGKKEWHIDHIKPIDYFIKNKDFALLEVQKECFNISNLQPLWAKDNLSKSNSISEKDIY